MQIKIFGEDIGIYQRSQRQECRQVLRMYLELGNRKLLTLEALFSPMSFLLLCVIFILSVLTNFFTTQFM